MDTKSDHEGAVTSLHHVVFNTGAHTEVDCLCCLGDAF